LRQGFPQQRSHSCSLMDIFLSLAHERPKRTRPLRFISLFFPNSLVLVETNTLEGSEGERSVPVFDQYQ
jgi:hypothetical protein